jgi:hypothetical protein
VGTSCIIRGLTNGTRYSVTVFARNASGRSDAAPIRKATPRR